MQKAAYLQNFSELTAFFDAADVIDVKQFEGEASLRGFIAGMLSYYPWWLVMLYRVREILVGMLGLVRHEAPATLPSLRPEDVSFEPGDAVSFFTVRSAREERYWISETPEDKHLRAYFGVVREPLNDANSRYHLITSVYYKHWTGPVYFNLIRPFHHLVVARMARHGLAA